MEERYNITVRLFGGRYDERADTISMPQVIHHTVKHGRLVIHSNNGSTEYNLDDIYDWKITR